jgi:hypothetical protein
MFSSQLFLSSIHSFVLGSLYADTGGSGTGEALRHSILKRLNERSDSGIHRFGDAARRRRFGDGWVGRAAELVVALRLFEPADLGGGASSELAMAVEPEGPAICWAAIVGCGATDSATSSAASGGGLRRMHLFTCRLRFEFTPNRRPQVSQTKAGIHE